MAEEVEMTPVTADEPPKANPLAPKAAGIHKPAVGAPMAAMKPVASAATPKPGLKLPTQSALKPGLKLPPKPVIHKPSATATSPSLPKPLPKPVSGTAPAAAAATPAANKSMETLKSVTQKLKGTTQEIPQQAILRKTGIIADGAISDAQKEAAKHKTARIALSDAMGVAPVKEENAPMKTIRIKRPTSIPGATSPLAPKPTAPATQPAEAAAPADASATVTQRKTLKIARPSAGTVRPAGKFGVKQPASAPAAASAGGVADVADIPEMPMSPMPMVARPSAANDGPAWLCTISVLVQAVACVAIGALAWFLYQNTQVAYF